MKLNEIKKNPKNPRIIKDAKFKKLVKSIQDFPQMMELRPIIVDENNMILGGNMRFSAIKELKMNEIPDNWVKKASELTEEQKQEFIIKDNVGFGDWNFEDLKVDWDVELLEDWGVEIIDYSKGLEVNNMTDEDVDTEEYFDPIGNSAGLQRVVFLFDGKDEAESYLHNLKVEYKKRSMAWQVNLSTKST